MWKCIGVDYGQFLVFCRAFLLGRRVCLTFADKYTPRLSDLLHYPQGDIKVVKGLCIRSPLPQGVFGVYVHHNIHPFAGRDVKPVFEFVNYRQEMW